MRFPKIKKYIADHLDASVVACVFCSFLENALLCTDFLKSKGTKGLSKLFINSESKDTEDNMKNYFQDVTASIDEHIPEDHSMKYTDVVNMLDSSISVAFHHNIPRKCSQSD